MADEFPANQANHEQPHKLCDICTLTLLKVQNCARSWQDGNMIFEFDIEFDNPYSSLQSLAMAADGCSACLKIRPKWNQYPTNPQSYNCNFLSYSNDGSVYFKLNTRFNDEHGIGVNDFGNYVCLRPVYAEKERLSIPGYSAVNSTGADGCLSLARHWLQICRSEHETCRRPRDTIEQKQWRPTRLLQINCADGIVRLVQNDKIRTGVEYATLSYRWGILNPTHKLQQDNIAHWCEVGLPSRLSQTISDAIEVARFLGLAYIWIDSLCIIQDSPADWERESSLMSSVYKYTVCSIAATAAIDSSEGCFTQRKASNLLPIRLEFDNAKVTCALTTRAVQQDILNNGPDESQSVYGLYDLMPASGTWDEDVTHAPLNRRGWRILAPRILNFGIQQLYWECNELRASEVQPFGIPKGLGFDVGNNGVNFKTRFPFQLREQVYPASSVFTGRPNYGLRHSACQAWMSAVQAYTVSDPGKSENLSVPSDKLVAISAIARELQPHIKSRYLAGLWESDLFRQLCWRVYDQPDRRVESYRAPSWSWAAVKTSILFSYLPLASRGSNEPQTYYQLCDMISAKVTLAGPDAFGQVAGGFLRMKAQLLTVDVEDRERRMKAIYEGHDTEVFLDEHGPADISEASQAHRCFCLPLNLVLRPEYHMAAGHAKALRYTMVSLHALLLAKCEDRLTAGNRDVYRRIGLLTSLSSVSVNDPECTQQPLLSAIGRWDPNEPPSTMFKRNLDDLTEVDII